MTPEEWWESSRRGGTPPARRRLSRLPHAEQWRATIQLAVALAQGRAGWRYHDHSVTHEETWWWPTSPLVRPGDTGWWYVARRIARRARNLVRVATLAAMADRGWCDRGAIVRVLRRWRRSGAWERQCLRIEASRS